MSAPDPAPPQAEPASPNASVAAAPIETAPAETNVAALDAPRPTAPSDPKCAEAFTLHASASEAMAAGQVDAAREQWLKVVRDFPTCPEVPHAFLAFAEHSFANGDMEAAKRTYEKVAQFEDVELRGFARYKMAWCDMNLGDRQSALEGFIQVARQVGEGDTRPRLARLRDVALRDSVLAYVEVGKPDKAAAFYRHMAGASATALLARLAQLYRDRGELDSANLVCAAGC